MVNDRYKHAVSHILLFGVTFWCEYHTDHSGGWKWIYGSYGVLGFYTVLGAWRYGNPRYGDDVVRVYNLSYYMAMAFTLPCMVTQLYLSYGYDWRFSLIHVVLPVIPMARYLLDNTVEEDLFDLIVLGNIVSLGVISVMRENYYGIVTALSYAVNQFILKNRDFSEVPRRVIYNVALCFHAFFAYRALAEGH